MQAGLCKGISMLFSFSCIGIEVNHYRVPSTRTSGINFAYWVCNGAKAVDYGISWLWRYSFVPKPKRVFNKVYRLVSERLGSSEIGRQGFDRYVDHIVPHNKQDTQISQSKVLVPLCSWPNWCSHEGKVCPFQFWNFLLIGYRTTLSARVHYARV